MIEVPVITLDGPSGCGKGTLARWLAEQLHWHYLDSGALYRALAWWVLETKTDPNDLQRIEMMAKTLPVSWEGEALYLNQSLITEAIRTEPVGMMASQLAVLPTLRSALLARQRAAAQPPGLVAEGRDMGTCVFPQALIKIFIEASLEKRALWRQSQLQGMGWNVNLGELLAGLRARDERDKHRAVAPLKPAEGAYVLETSELSLEQARQALAAYVFQQLGVIGTAR